MERLNEYLLRPEFKQEFRTFMRSEMPLIRDVPAAEPIMWYFRWAMMTGFCLGIKKSEEEHERVADRV